MTIWQTILVFVVAPAGLYGIIALLAGGGRGTRAARYRPGQPWPYPAVWWTGNPEGIGPSAHPHEEDGHVPGDVLLGTAKGGARGNW